MAEAGTRRLLLFPVDQKGSALRLTRSCRRDTPKRMHKGSCLCKAVSFEVTGAIPAPDACHCTQCRKQSSHFFVSSDIPRSQVTIQGGDNVTWYQSSEKARRGFCSTCGSFLFWDPLHKDWIGVAMGAFEKPTNTKIRVHIHVADKGDYYDIRDDLPQNQH